MPDDSGAGRSAGRPENSEEALRAAETARDAAEAANRAKTEFLAVVSHEVRTPLNGILGYLDLLKSGVGGPIGEEHAEYVERARRSGKHLLALIEEILDIALIESGQVRIEPTPGNLGDVIDAAVALVAPQANQGRIKVLNAGAGAGGGPSYLGQEDRVRQILVNLLANAVKFTDPGGSVTISAGAVDRPPEGAVAPTGAAAFVRVEDTGAGIEPERLAAIFEPTVGEEQASRPSRERRGVGLGLAISRRLARLMGGDVTVASTPGVGSIFVLWLPAAVGPEGSLGGFPEEPGAVPDAALRTVGEVILKELERTLRIFVGRLRTDGSIPTAHVHDETVLEDHMATFLADLGHSLIAMDETTDAEGEHLREGADIQGRVARRHGEQRARLGWTEDEIRREFALLKEELEAAVERRTRHAHTAKGEAVQRALTMLLDRAVRESVNGLRHAVDSGSVSNS